jgi:Cd(II)/Pb(II)-responsive transcriptional regulator
MQIGALAKRTGCQVETIRYYEREGLLAEPERSEGNYRLYNDEHVERLIFIRNCRALDMTLDEIRSLLRFKENPRDNCSSVNDLINEHIQHVRTRINALQALEEQLNDLGRRCAVEQAIGDCGILHRLTDIDVANTLSESADSHVGKSHRH